MGQRHLQNIKDMGLDLAGVCDALEATLKEAGESFQLPAEQCFTETEKLLAEAKPECLIIATTAPSHAELVIAAAKAGCRYILCEKPMAVSVQQCHDMVEACRELGTHLAINHQMRFMEQYTRPKSLLESERFGGLTTIQVLAGNFGLSMNGTHYIEMFRFLTGEDPETVQAWFGEEKVPNPRGEQFEDRGGCLRLVSPKGIRFYLDASTDQGHGVRVLYGSRNGQIFVDELEGKMIPTVRLSEHAAMPTTRYGMPWEEYEESISPADSLKPSRDVLGALLAGKNYPSGEEGLVIIRTMLAAYHSHENQNRIVRLDEEGLPLDRVFPWA
jgi:predicted dehydrogenase